MAGTISLLCPEEIKLHSIVHHKQMFWFHFYHTAVHKNIFEGFTVLLSMIILLI